MQSIAKSHSSQSNSLECNRCTILTRFRGTEFQSHGSTSDKPKPWNPKNPQLPQTRRNMQEMQIAVAAASKSDVNPGYYNQHPRKIRRAHKLIGISKVSQLPDLKFQCQGHATTCRTSLKRISKANDGNGNHIPSSTNYMQITCIDHKFFVRIASGLSTGVESARSLRSSYLVSYRIVFCTILVPY